MWICERGYVKSRLCRDYALFGNRLWMCGKRICEVESMQRLRSVRKEVVDM